MTVLKGKGAVVTGAASGIGRAIATAFTEAGARVLLCDRNAKGLDAVASELGDDALGRVTDVSEESQVEGAMRDARNAFGSLDIVVSCAGFGAIAPLTDLSADQWKSVQAVTLGGVFYGVKHALGSGRELSSRWTAEELQRFLHDAIRLVARSVVQHGAIGPHDETPSVRRSFRHETAVEVLMGHGVRGGRSSAARQDANCTSSRLHQATRQQELLSPGVPPVAVAGPIVLAAEIERLLGGLGLVSRVIACVSNSSSAAEFALLVDRPVKRVEVLP